MEFLKNRRIEINIGKTINMGNYESARIDFGLAGDISDIADINEEYREMYKYLNDIISKVVKQIKSKNNV